MTRCDRKRIFSWQTGIAALAVVSLVLLSLFGLNRDGGSFATLSNSMDPTLHMAPIEKERIGPEKGLHAQIEPVTDKQTFIFHPRSAEAGPKRRAAVFRIPDRYFTQISGREAKDVWGLNLVVQYPEMTNDFPPGRCGDKCDQQIWINIEYKNDFMKSKAQSNYDNNIIYELEKKGRWPNGNVAHSRQAGILRSLSRNQSNFSQFKKNRILYQ